MHTRHTIAALALLVLTMTLGCSSSSSPTAPTAPSPATKAAATPPATSTAPVAAAHILHPVNFAMIQGLVTFPPRNEPNVFFQDLQALYRDVLRRSQSSSTYVDSEGENVWLTEYFRFYLNGCSHEEAMVRTLSEITTGAALPTCGSSTADFPPRNLPNEFQGRLEAVYRDVLRRSQVLSFVDSEGANVWLAQYLRLRVSGCGHIDAENKVFTEIRGGGVQASCANVPAQPPTTAPGSSSVTGTVAPLGINRHLLTIASNGTLGVGLAWSNPATDLDLYLTSTSCSGYPPSSCNILAASQKSVGTGESVGRSGVRAGEQYYVWVDNFSNRSESYALASLVLPLLSIGDRAQFVVGPAEPQTDKPAGASKTN